MNQSKFSLADVLTVLAAVAFGFGCFLGTNFYTLGNFSQSIVLSAIISVLLSGTALGAKLLKRTSRNFKICYVWEMILLVLFTGLTAFFAYSPFPHYFVVSEEQVEIRSKLNSNIKQAENMFTEYERYAENREYNYKSQLRSAVVTKNINSSDYTKYGFENNGITDNEQIDNKMFTLHADLFPTNYSDTINKNGIKEVATTWLSDAKNKIEKWKSIGIVDVVNEVGQNSNDWLNKLVEFSAVREKGEPEQTRDFDYPLSFDNVKKHFTTLGKPTPVSLGLAVVAYLMMLLPWFAAQLHSKNPGRKKLILMIFGTSKSSSNEL
jgi:hypothetical protein